MKSVLVRQFCLGLGVVILAFFVYMGPVRADQPYDEYFKEYVLSIRKASSPVECRNLADVKLQKKINLAQIYNQKARTPSFMLGKWGYTGPDQTERQAVNEVLALCDKPEDELLALARTYERGHTVSKDIEIATSLYMYLFFAYNHAEAIEHLEDLGFIVR